MRRSVTDKNSSDRAGPVVLKLHSKEELRSHIYEKEFEWRLPSQRELIFLWTIQGSGKHGVYGLDLQRAISECSGENETVSHGTLYSTLKRLRQKGWIDSYEGDALGGGAKRQYYFLTKDGERILERITQFLSDLQQWQPIQRETN